MGGAVARSRGIWVMGLFAVVLLFVVRGRREALWLALRKEFFMKILSFEWDFFLIGQGLSVEGYKGRLGLMVLGGYGN